MNARKQKVFEERMKSRHEYKRPQKIDYRDEIGLEDIQMLVKRRRYWGYVDAAIRKELEYIYKNGAKLFDQAIAIENSPLMKALS